MVDYNPQMTQAAYITIPMALVEDPGFNASALKLYMYLKYYKHDEGPTMTHMGDIIGVDPKSIQRYLKDLEKRGLIEIIKKCGVINKYNIL